MRLSLRPRAELDLDQAYAWYESRREGLGETFLAAVDTGFGRLLREPRLFAAGHDRVRRARVDRFPYWIYYVVRDDRIDVLAVYHARRRPRRFDP